VTGQVSSTASLPPARSAKRWLSNWLRSIGPGFVFVLTVLGTGDIVANTTAGAGYGYSLIWVLGITLVCRFVWVNTSAKYVLVTGESLLTGYGRLGRWVVWVVLATVILIRHLNNLIVIVMIGSSSDLLLSLPTAWSAEIWALVFTLIGFAMMFWGGYPVIESFCKVLIGVMGGSLILAALLSKPDPVAIVGGALVPSLPQAQGLYSAILLVMALIGTEAGSMENLTYPYFIQEKRWKDVSFLKRQRSDLALGVLCMFIMGALLQISAAATLHPEGIDVEDADDLVRVFSDTQGVVGWIVFGLGLWGASFSSLIGGTTGCALIVTDICRTFVPRLEKKNTRDGNYRVKNDPLYRWAIVFWCVSPLYILFTGVQPVWLVITVSSLVVLAIPLLAIALMKITNDRQLMGAYRNGWLTNSIMGVLVFLAVFFTLRNAIDLWNA
jgi:Mn2+/Fe2+ NRAMP family transporter